MCDFVGAVINMLQKIVLLTEVTERNATKYRTTVAICCNNMKRMFIYLCTCQ